MRSFSVIFGAVADGRYAQVDAPLGRYCFAQTLALTTADAVIPLAAGIYTVTPDAAVDTTVLGLDVDTTAQPPASGSAAAEGIATIPKEQSVNIVCDRPISLHARVLAGTATLRLTRRAP
jgi:hypothetical protein